jgi:tetratricopeptide (TPR) repeat protein
MVRCLQRRWFPATALVLLAIAAAGCRKTPAPQAQNKSAKVENSAQWADGLFTFAMTNLNRLEEFDASEVPAAIVHRMTSIQNTGKIPPEFEGDTILASWAEPDMLQQIVNRLNQWGEVQATPADWTLDPLVKNLPKPLAELSAVRALDQKIQFSTYDGFCLFEAACLRDISNWARGKKTDDLDRARNLFDWTVRNVQLELDVQDRIPQMPWETLMLGRGTATERAWVYILLLRQQGIDAGLLAFPMAAPSSAAGSNDEEKQKPSKKQSEAAAVMYRGWCVAVLVGDKDKKAYLFEPTLGLPIPAPDGVRVEGGRLDIFPATLDQVAANPKLLERLDFDAQHPYWARSADLKRLTVLVEASPMYLSKGGKLIESRLAGEQHMVLTTSPTAVGDRLKAAVHAERARLWLEPYETLLVRSHLMPRGVQHWLETFFPLFAGPETCLFKARLLHFKGRFIDTPGAITYYQMARPSDSELLEGGAELTKALQEKYEKQMESELPDTAPERLAEARPHLYQLAGEMASQRVRFRNMSCMRGKVAASFWLGVISFEQGGYAPAIDYFSKRVLEASPASPWTVGARYNLGRTHEAAGEPQRAIDAYTGGSISPLFHGALLRARWLNELTRTSRR